MVGSGSVSSWSVTTEALATSCTFVESPIDHHGRGHGGRGRGQGLWKEPRATGRDRLIRAPGIEQHLV